MKLATFSDSAGIRVGVVAGDHLVDLSVASPGLPTDMVSLLDGGQDCLEAARRAATGSAGVLALGEVRLEATVRPRKFLIVGRNYRTYRPKMEASEEDEVTAARLRRTIRHELDIDGMQAAGHQVWVSKEVSCITGPFDPIRIPKVSGEVIYENELGVVIGKRCKYVTRDTAPGVIAGYVVCNDVTATDWAGYSPTYMLSKSFDTFGPIGPWLVTCDEIDDPHSLEMRASISGELDQVGSTSAMEVDCFGLIEYLSQVVTLEAGDVLATGTPSVPLRFLRDGDVVRCEIEGLGAIENPVELELEP